MTSDGPPVASPRRPIRAVLRAAVLAGFLAAGAAASAQDLSAATPKDAIFARKILMNSVSDNMDELEGMAQSSKPIDMDEAHEHSDIVSVLLLVFPHVFLPSTNQWKPGVTDRDPATDTYASPDLWIDFADFYKRATEAADIAFQASRANTEGDFRRHVAQLRQACDACHARYRKTE